MAGRRLGGPERGGGAYLPPFLFLCIPALEVPLELEASCHEMMPQPPPLPKRAHLQQQPLCGLWGGHSPCWQPLRGSGPEDLYGRTTMTQPKPHTQPPAEGCGKSQHSIAFGKAPRREADSRQKCSVRFPAGHRQGGLTDRLFFFTRPWFKSFQAQNSIAFGKAPRRGERCERAVYAVRRHMLGQGRYGIRGWHAWSPNEKNQFRKFYCLRQVHLAENLHRATRTQNRVGTT